VPLVPKATLDPLDAMVLLEPPDHRVLLVKRAMSEL